jgi:hypothetical protein
MQLNEDLFQRSTATRHHPSTDRKSDRLTWTHTAPMGFTGWSQRDTLTTGHGHCRDNRRQHTLEVERIVRSLSARGYKLHAFGAKVLGLARYADAIASSDFASWSLRGRHIPGCTSSHRSESNCLRFALAWHTKLLDSLPNGTPGHGEHQRPPDPPSSRHPANPSRASRRTSAVRAAGPAPGAHPATRRPRNSRGSPATVRRRPTYLVPVADERQTRRFHDGERNQA